MSIEKLENTYEKMKTRKKRKIKLSCVPWPGSPRLASGLETMSVEAIIYVYAHIVSKVGQSAEHAKIGDPIRARRGTTENANFDSFPHVAD